MLPTMSRLSPLLLVFFVTSVLALQRVVDPIYSQYAVSSTVLELTDRNRADPIQPSARRRLVVTALTPSSLKESCKGKRATYMPKKQAPLADLVYSPFGWPNGTFSTFRTTVAADSGCTPVHRGQDSDDLILFSPAASTSRLVYQVLAHSLVSKGFKILMIDHPYDADYVEFSNGEIIKGIEVDATNAVQMIDVRAKDIEYLLKGLERPKSSLSKSLGIQNISKTKIAMLGHSLGGATVAKILSSSSNPRVLAGINMDGDFFGNFTQQVVSKPIMLLGQTTKVNAEEGSTWPTFFEKSTNPSLLRKWFTVTGSQHYTFSDLPLLVESLGATQSLREAASTILGTLSSRRGQVITSEYIAAFFQLALHNQSSPLLQANSTSFPEVNLIH